LSSSLRDSGRRSVSYEEEESQREEQREGSKKETHVDKLGESRITPLLLLKLVLPVQLMRSVLDERPKVRHHVEEDVANVVDDVGLLLTLVEEFREADVDRVDLEDIPKDLLDKVFAASFGDDVGGTEGFDPGL
jgi:hypothetical protein